MGANMEDWIPSEADKNAGTGKYGSCCTEIDIWEANKMATAYTMHSCSPGEQTRCDGPDCGDNGEDRFKGLCDKNGCDISHTGWAPTTSLVRGPTSRLTAPSRLRSPH